MNLSLAIAMAVTTAATMAVPLACARAETSGTPPAQKAEHGPFYCDQSALDPERRTRHFDVLGPALIAKRTAVRELADGYEIGFPSDRETFQQLAEYVGDERVCCPFFDIVLRATADGGPLWFRVTGRPGTKQFIEADAGGWIKPVAAKKK
jgi:hypothetical protein